MRAHSMRLTEKSRPIGRSLKTQQRTVEVDVVSKVISLERR